MSESNVPEKIKKKIKCDVKRPPPPRSDATYTSICVGTRALKLNTEIR